MKLIDQVMKEFQDKKLTNETQADTNLRNALNNPEFKNAYNLIRSLQLDYAKLKYASKDTSKVLNEIKIAKETLRNTADKLSIDTSTLKPNYDCKLCKDTGKIGNEYCQCFKSALSKTLLINCGLDYNNLPDFDNMSYEIVKNPPQKTQYMKLCEIFKNYVSKLKTTDKKLFLLSGQVGVGKTYLIKATTHEAIKNGNFALYTTAFDLNKAFLGYHCAKLEDKDEILDKYLSCDLLLIDDLGTENKLNNVTTEYLYLVINQRLESGKNTIITTNLQINELQDRYDERIMSRISNKQTCITTILNGEDLRLN